MAVALFVAGSLTMGFFVFTVWLARIGVWPFALMLAALGVAAIAAPFHNPGPWAGPYESVWARQRVQPILARLCLVGGMPMPRIAVHPMDAPLSWTTEIPPRTPVIHVTTGLVARAPDDALTPILAHELAHVANYDAPVMTLVAGLPTAALRTLDGMLAAPSGSHWTADELPYRLAAACGVVVAYPLGMALVLPYLLAARTFSRQRELAADRGAASLTGSPAGVAHALLDVTNEIRRIPRTDLRTIGSRDLFHFVPARHEETSGIFGPFATHPPLSVRVAQLEEMERALQAARPVLPPEPA